MAAPGPRTGSPGAQLIMPRPDCPRRERGQVIAVIDTGRGHLTTGLRQGGLPALDAGRWPPTMAAQLGASRTSYVSVPLPYHDYADITPTRPRRIPTAYRLWYRRG